MGKVNVALIVAVVVLLVGGIGAIIYCNDLSSKNPSTATPTPESTPNQPTAGTYDIVITYSKPYQALQRVTRNESTQQVQVVALDVEFSNYTKNWIFETEKFYVFNEHQPFPRSPIQIEKTINASTSSQGNVFSTKLYFDIPLQSNLVLGYSSPEPLNILWIQKP